jgi:hypothetical protein
MQWELIRSALLGVLSALEVRYFVKYERTGFQTLWKHLELSAAQAPWMRDLTPERLESIVEELTAELDPIYRRAGEVQFGTLSEKSIRDWILAHPGCVSLNKA